MLHKLKFERLVNSVKECVHIFLGIEIFSFKFLVLVIVFPMVKSEAVKFISGNLCF